MRWLLNLFRRKPQPRPTQPQGLRLVSSAKPQASSARRTGSSDSDWPWTPSHSYNYGGDWSAGDSQGGSCAGPDSSSSGSDGGSCSSD